MSNTKHIAIERLDHLIKELDLLSIYLEKTVFPESFKDFKEGKITQVELAPIFIVKDSIPDFNLNLKKLQKVQDKVFV